MMFDDLKPGLNSLERTEDNQLSLFDCSDKYILPPVYYSNASSKKSKASNRRKSNKSKQSNKNIDKEQFSLSNIQTMEAKKEFKNSGVGVISTATPEIKDKNSVLGVVSAKTKRDLDKRNKELLKVREHPYIRVQHILTEAEKKLYKFLRLRLKDNIIIFSKMRLADIVNVNEAQTRDTKALTKIAYKHVDFSIVSPDLELICVVELDDYTHDTKEGIERDKFVESVLHDCGVPLYRIKCRIDNITSEDTKGIEMCVLEHMAPTCPICGRPMEPKESRQKYNFGHRFYGCMGFYETGENKCNFTIDID